MARARKAAITRKPLAPKDTNIPQPTRAPKQQQQQDLHQQLIEANYKEAERRIAAIRAVRDADVEGFLTQLRVARSMLSEEVLSMRLSDFVKKFCPDRAVCKASESGIVELRTHHGASTCLECAPSAASSFEFHDNHVPHSHVQPTPLGFPFSSSTVKEQLLQSIDKHTHSEIDDDEFLKMLESFKDSKTWQAGLSTPSAAHDSHLMAGVTPKTIRLPQKGEILMSVNGSPLGVFGKEGFTAIPEERPRKARRRLRASAQSHL